MSMEQILEEGFERCIDALIGEDKKSRGADPYTAVYDPDGSLGLQATCTAFGEVIVYDPENGANYS